jgi:hypothetical protein
MSPEDRKTRLREIHAELREIRDKRKAAQELIPRRDRLIREALELGDSQRQLVSHSGLEKSRIDEISARSPGGN